ncbi:hypothetical protein M0805_005820 [Coniferiporia weirii]|nr:hypothetical protein M0805_005820 [Coniferiporia weirii]
MNEQLQYSAAAHVPLIKSPSLRIPRPIEAPPDIHPLPDDINAYFVYAFTLEPHVTTLEASRRSTLAAHTTRHEAFLRQREENKERMRRDALRRIAPGFEPQSAPLVPTRVSSGEGRSDEMVASGPDASGAGTGHVRQRSVMDDLVDHLAALDAAADAGGEGPSGSRATPGNAGAGRFL